MPVLRDPENPIAVNPREWAYLGEFLLRDATAAAFRTEIVLEDM